MFRINHLLYQERHSREQEAAECPPKYEDVYDARSSIRQQANAGKLFNHEMCIHMSIMLVNP